MRVLQIIRRGANGKADEDADVHPGPPWVHPGPPLMHREGKLLDIGSHAQKTLNDNVVIFSSDILIHFELFL